MEGIELRPWEEGFTVPERFNMVSLLLERHLEQGRGKFVATFLGAMKIGAVPVPINVLATPSDLAYFLNDSRSKVVVVGQEFLPKVAAIRKESALLRHIIVAGDDP